MCCVIHSPSQFVVSGSPKGANTIYKQRLSRCCIKVSPRDITVILLSRLGACKWLNGVQQFVSQLILHGIVLSISVYQLCMCQQSERCWYCFLLLNCGDTISIGAFWCFNLGLVKMVLQVDWKCNMSVPPFFWCETGFCLQLKQQQAHMDILNIIIDLNRGLQQTLEQSTIRNILVQLFPQFSVMEQLYCFKWLLSLSASIAFLFGD